MSPSGVTIPRLHTYPRRRTAILAGVVLIHCVAAWAYLRYGLKTDIPAFPPMMVTMIPAPGPSPSAGSPANAPDPHGSIVQPAPGGSTAAPEPAAPRNLP